MRVKISKEEFQDLYENKKLTTFQIAEKFNCCQATIWKKLKELNIHPRLPGVKRVNISKEKIYDLYINKKFSTWKIEKELSIPRSTIHRKLKEFKIKIRDRADSHIVNFRKNFSEDPIEKAYLIGFRIGDLGVRKIWPNSKTITVASGSTIKEQIDLIADLFKNYGQVKISEAKNNKINIWVNLNESFNFLLSKEIPYWVLKNKKTFFSFLAGFSDAEGCISKNKKIDYYSLSNCDDLILKIIKMNLEKYNIFSPDPYFNKRKGNITFEKYRFNYDYWSLRISRKENLLKLLIALKPYIKHKNKIKALNIAIESINYRNNESK